MKTEFLEKLLPESLENRAEIIRQIFAENGKDVNAEKARYADYESLKEQLTAAKATISEMEGKKADAEELQKQIDAYRAKEAERERKEATEQAHAALVSRFDAAAGEKKFLHPMVREGVIAEFIRAAEDPGNKGKGDREIFENITKDKD